MDRFLDHPRIESWPAGDSSARPAFTERVGEDTVLEKFNRYFEGVVADTPDLIRDAQEIRYQVYCVEHPFENRADHPDGLEKDEFDDHAIHSVLIHRPSAKAIGTVRLVLPRPGAPERSFAIQQLTDHPLLKDRLRFPLETTAEISRFSISKQFRRRKSDTLYDHDETAAEQESVGRRSGPLMRLGLMQTIVRMSAERGMTHWCAVMEPKLLRMLAAMSIHFEPIGPLVEYHGLRQPCYGEIATVLNSMRREVPAYWDVVTDSGALWDRLNGLSAAA